MATIECPNCGCDNAYHDGVSYFCPDCDFEWGKSIEDEDDDEEDISDDDHHFSDEDESDGEKTYKHFHSKR